MKYNDKINHRKIHLERIDYNLINRISKLEELLFRAETQLVFNIEHFSETDYSSRAHVRESIDDFQSILEGFKILINLRRKLKKLRSTYEIRRK